LHPPNALERYSTHLAGTLPLLKKTGFSTRGGVVLLQDTISLAPTQGDEYFVGNYSIEETLLGLGRRVISAEINKSSFR